MPDGDYGKFIEGYCERTGKEEEGGKFSPFEPGDFVTEDGKVLGHHKGIIHYTIGQRKGLGLSLPQPLYVCRKDLDKNKVVLAPNDRLFQDTLEAGELNFISGEYPRGAFRCCAKIRYKQKEAPATVTPIMLVRGITIVIKIPSIRSLGLICRLTIDTERSKSSRPLAER